MNTEEYDKRGLLVNPGRAEGPVPYLNDLIDSINSKIHKYMVQKSKKNEKEKKKKKIDLHKREYLTFSVYSSNRYHFQFVSKGI